MRQGFNASGSAFAGMFATGGTIPAGHWGVVGERGPEPVFAGASSARVLSHDEGREMFGGGGQGEIVVNIRGDVVPAAGVSEDEVIEILERSPRSKEIMRRAVLGGRGTGRRTAGDYAS